MKIKNVLLLAAGEIGVYDHVLEKLSENNATDDKVVSTLLRCFNLVENEIALDYLPLKAEDTMDSSSGTIAFSDLSNSPVRILSVTDEWGNALKFRLFPDYLRTQAGKVVVLYTYAPVEKTIDGESDFTTSISERVVAFGVCAEYYTACGLYEQAAVFDVKYKDALKAAISSRKSRVIASRRWA